VVIAASKERGWDHSIEYKLAVPFNTASLNDQMSVSVYRELRRLAETYLRYERRDHTLQPTALVHEAYVRLAEQRKVIWQNREHFVGVAATMMRRILVNYAVRRNSDKRGGGLPPLSLAHVERHLQLASVDIIALDEALRRFAADYPQECRIVDLRFFGGLSIEEAAGVIGVSGSTIERDWRFARSWLRRELTR
jgi:RNA polymerase sigma factor (TIGR02999 family)